MPYEHVRAKKRKLAWVDPEETREKIKECMHERG